jgi:hypothetical protein
MYQVITSLVVDGTLVHMGSNTSPLPVPLIAAMTNYMRIIGMNTTPVPKRKLLWTGFKMVFPKWMIWSHIVLIYKKLTERWSERLVNGRRQYGGWWYTLSFGLD